MPKRTLTILTDRFPIGLEMDVSYPNFQVSLTLLFRSILAAVAMSVCSLSGSAIAQIPVPKDLPQRVEIHSIPTLTLSDSQFLTGDSNATAAAVAGELSLAPGTGRLPVVVLMHGSSRPCCGHRIFAWITWPKAIHADA